MQHQIRTKGGQALYLLTFFSAQLEEHAGDLVDVDLSFPLDIEVVKYRADDTVQQVPSKVSRDYITT